MKKIQIRKDCYEVAILRRRAEEKHGSIMHTPTNFDKLSTDIMENTKEYLSPTTLKRLWGYIDGSDIIRYSTLNILSQYLGKKDWDDFVESLDTEGNETSKEYYNATIESQNLKVGDVLILSWWPDRVVEIEYNGDNNFEVISSLNSKLCVRDTFRCPLIVDGEPLLLDCYVHDGMTPTKYMCGKEGGVKVMKKL